MCGRQVVNAGPRRRPTHAVVEDLHQRSLRSAGRPNRGLGRGIAFADGEIERASALAVFATPSQNWSTSGGTTGQNRTSVDPLRMACLLLEKAS